MLNFKPVAGVILAALSVVTKLNKFIFYFIVLVVNENIEQHQN